MKHFNINVSGKGLVIAALLCQIHFAPLAAQMQAGQTYLYHHNNDQSKEGYVFDINLKYGVHLQPLTGYYWLVTDVQHVISNRGYVYEGQFYSPNQLPVQYSGTSKILENVRPEMTFSYGSQILNPGCFSKGNADYNNILAVPTTIIIPDVPKGTATGDIVNRLYIQSVRLCNDIGSSTGSLRNYDLERWLRNKKQQDEAAEHIRDANNYLAQGNSDAAETAFNLALKADPDNQDAAAGLQKVQSQREQLAAREREREEAGQKAAASAAELEKLGLYREAADAYGRAAENSTDSDTYLARQQAMIDQLKATNLERERAKNQQIMETQSDLNDAHFSLLQSAASLLFPIDVADRDRNIRRFRGAQLHFDFGLHGVIVPVQENISSSSYNGQDYTYQFYDEQGQHTSLGLRSGLLFYPINTAVLKAGFGGKGAVGYMSDGQWSYQYEGYGRAEFGFRSFRIFSEFGYGFHSFEKSTLITSSSMRYNINTGLSEDVEVTIVSDASVQQNYKRFVLGANIKPRARADENDLYFVADIDIFYTSMLLPATAPFTGNAVAQGIGLNIHRNHRFALSLEYYFDFPVLITSEKKIERAGMFSASYRRSFDRFWGKRK